MKKHNYYIKSLPSVAVPRCRSAVYVDITEKKVVIYKRLILTVFCLGIIYFPCKGESADKKNTDKKNVEKWYIVSRHGDYMPLKKLLIRYKELQGASTPQELVDKLKKNGDDVELVDMFANITKEEKEKLKILKVKAYTLTSKSKELALIITNKITNEMAEELKP